MNVNNVPITIRTCTYAAQNGHVECLKYAFERSYIIKYKYRSEISEMAARYGQLECLKSEYGNNFYHGMKKHVLALL